MDKVTEEVGTVTVVACYYVIDNDKKPFIEQHIYVGMYNMTK